MEYFVNGIFFAFGTAIGIGVIVAFIELREKIERNKRYGRKWWKI